MIALDGNLEKFKKEIDMLCLNKFPSVHKPKVFLTCRSNMRPVEHYIDVIKLYIEKTKEWYPNFEFDYRTTLVTNEKEIMETDICKKLEILDDYLRENGNTLSLSTGISSHYFDFRETLQANRKLEKIADTIKNATTNINGQEEPLSNFEKFMMAYEFVTDFVYKETDNESYESRNWISVMEGDCIVCVGYSSLLTNLCDRIFSKDEVKVVKQSSTVYNDRDFNVGGHQNNMIFIKDEKYNINGAYYVDACWDSKSDNVKTNSFCCIPLSDVLNLKKGRLIFSTSVLDFYLDQDEEYSQYKNQLNEEKTLSSFKDLSKEEKINSFLFDQENDSAKYYREQLGEVLDYDGPKGIFKTSLINAEEEQVLINNKKNCEEQIKEKYAHIFGKYKELEIPMLTEKMIESANMGPYLEIIDSAHPDEERVIEAIEFFSQAFNSDYIQRVMLPKCHEFGFKVQDLGGFIAGTIAEATYNENRKILLEKKEKYAEYAKNKNANNFIKKINEIANVDPVPLEAYLNSFRIIGEKLGYKGQKLDEFVENRLMLTIETTQDSFNIENSRSCFATTRLEDLQIVHKGK
ncbi:MAG: hypothetical protein E7184_00355 [Erysipelotrichaceae bacterium]|nr:hypothetical protein [Erysipelotrichaceae bacterium]